MGEFEQFDNAAFQAATVPRRNLHRCSRVPQINISTSISAPVNRVFDLARSIDLHTISTASTSERAISGVTSGLIGLNDEVTWQARHFGVTQNLTVRITAFDKPKYFKDIMLKGAFKSMEHEHYFERHNDGTVMRDVFVFKTPLGILGRLADFVFLERYMRSFILQRNEILKTVAESGEWARFVQDVQQSDD